MIVEKCYCSGVVRDFAGPYFVSEDNMAFGKPAKYWKLDPARSVVVFFLILQLFVGCFLDSAREILRKIVIMAEELCCFE